MTDPVWDGLLRRFHQAKSRKEVKTMGEFIEELNKAYDARQNREAIGAFS